MLFGRGALTGPAVAKTLINNEIPFTFCAVGPIIGLNAWL